MTAIMNTGLNLAGLRSEFFQKFDGTKSEFGNLTTRVQSTKDEEKYSWLGSIPMMREWGTGRKAVGIRTETYNLANQRYESTIKVDRNEISDDKTGQIKMRINELAGRAATHKDFLIGQLLNNGDQTGFNSYDGVTFFNDAHSSGASGNQDNKLTSAAVVQADPTTDEFKKAMRAAISALLGFKDDVGLPMSTTGATGLVAVVPPNMFMTALEAVSATVVSNTSNVLQGAARVISFPFLSSTTKWFLLKTDEAIRPFVFQDREPVEFGALEEKSDEGFMREEYVYGCRARYAISFAYWQYAAQITFVAP